jgi:hypothetical protein
VIVISGPIVRMPAGDTSIRIDAGRLVASPLISSGASPLAAVVGGLSLMIDVVVAWPVVAVVDADVSSDVGAGSSTAVDSVASSNTTSLAEVQAAPIRTSTMAMTNVMIERSRPGLY